MNNEKWEKGISEIKNINLSENEKVVLLQKILTRSPYNPIVSPIFSPSKLFTRHYTAIVSTVLIFVIAGSVSVSADNSLPGNILYPIKIKVTEPMRDLIKISTEDKTEWQIEKVNRRIEEAETLAAQEKLDDKKREEIQELFEKSFSKIDDSVKSFEASSTRERVKSELEKRIEIHSKIVEEVNKDKENKEDNELEKFEKNITSVVNKKAKSKGDTERDEEAEGYKEDIDKMVEKRLKELEKEREKTQKRK